MKNAQATWNTILPLIVVIFVLVAVIIVFYTQWDKILSMLGVATDEVNSSISNIKVSE